MYWGFAIPVSAVAHYNMLESTVGISKNRLGVEKIKMTVGLVL
jgi:hypothetical protein